MTIEDFKIIGLGYDHITSVADLEKLCFSNPISENNIKNILIDGIGKGFVCIDTKNNKIASYGGVMVVADEAQVLNVATHPDYRGMGLAGLVLEKIINYSQAAGASFITLEVRESNAIAISLYKSCGFCEVGRIKQYYKHPSEDALILKKEF